MRREAGFTLIELLVVIVIISLIGGMVMLRQPMHSAGLNLDATQRAITAAMRLARSRAIAQDRIVTVVTGPAGYAVDNAPPQALPARQVLTAAKLSFLPDGGAAGGPVILAAPGRRVEIDANWLTGRVAQHELAAK